MRSSRSFSFDLLTFWKDRSWLRLAAATCANALLLTLVLGSREISLCFLPFWQQSRLPVGLPAGVPVWRPCSQFCDGGGLEYRFVQDRTVDQSPSILLLLSPPF